MPESMRKPLIPIVKTSGLYLVPHQHGDDRRFARLFAEAWKRVPLWARRRMVAHWRKEDPVRLWTAAINPRALPVNGRLEGEAFVSPRVELLFGWEGCQDDDIICPGMPEEMHGGETGCAGANGYVVRFHAPRVDRMPEKVVQDPIGHELAHVVQYAIGHKVRFGHEVSNGELEEDADEIMVCWGFDPYSIDKWSADVGLTRRVECRSVKEMIDAMFSPGGVCGPGGRYYRGE